MFWLHVAGIGIGITDRYTTRRKRVNILVSENRPQVSLFSGKYDRSSKKKSANIAGVERKTVSGLLREAIAW